MYERAYGERYDQTLTTTQIAQRFRDDLKKAIQERRLPPELKLSVQTRYFSGGSSIDVRVMRYNGSILTSDWRDYYSTLANSKVLPPQPPPERYTKWAKELLDVLSTMLRAYNHDGSDIQSDYFDVNFYDSVEFHRDLLKAAGEQ